MMGTMTGVCSVQLACAVLACSISTSSGFLRTSKVFDGTLEPSDPNKCETEDITFTSILLDDPRLNSSIGFAYKNRSTDRRYVAVGIDRVTRVNETVSQFTVYNITLADGVPTKSLYFYVTSYYWEEFGDMNKTLQLGETTSVRVYPLPEEVQDFNCVVLNYVTMNCSWNYGKKYGENIPEVIFQWKNLSQSDSWKDCSDLNNKIGYCEWKNLAAENIEYSNITARLQLNQHCGINVSSLFQIDTSKIVKPNPLSSISSKVVNSTCIWLSWQTHNSQPQYPKEHRILVFVKGVNIQEERFNTKDGSEEFSHSRTFCNLHPYTEYMFSVSIQPTGIYSGYFSDPSDTVSMTYSDIPSASPEVIEGGYSWKHRDCAEKSQKRNVCLFWKPIKEEHKNGPMIGLEGKFTALRMEEQSVEKWAEDLTYGCSILLCDMSYNFTVRARNVNGTSESVSTLTIPSFTTEIKRPQFIVESANTSDVYISWEHTWKHRVEEFVVAWCHNKNGDCKSDHEVNWRRFPSGTTNVVLQINSSSQFLYGVGAITEQGSSGIDWQDCIYLKDITPKRVPQNVVVSAGSEDNTLIVTWDKLACRSDEPYIHMYNVRYNKLHDTHQKSLNVTQSEEARVVLRDLDEDQEYIVTIGGITQDGRYGPHSQPITAVPVNKSLKPSEIAGISMAALVGVILGGVGVFCVVRRCKRRAQEVIKQAGAITIPDVLDHELHTNTGRKDSNDSGFETTPPPEMSTRGNELSRTSPVLPNYYRSAAIGNGDQDVTVTDMYVLKPDMTHPIHEPSDRSVIQNHQHRKKSNLTIIIPKPVAFVESIGSRMSLSREENNIALKSLKVKSSGKAKFKRVPHDTGDNTVNNIIPTITNIPCPKEMLENDSSFDDENECKNEDNCQHLKGNSLSSFVSETKLPLSGRESIVQENEHSNRSGYVTTTATPSLIQQSTHIATSLTQEKSDVNDVSNKQVSRPCFNSHNVTSRQQFTKSSIAKSQDTLVLDDQSIRNTNTGSGSLPLSTATSNETPDCCKQSLTAHHHHFSEPTLPGNTAVTEDAIIVTNSQQQMNHPCTSQTSTGAIQNQTESEIQCTDGYVHQSKAVQDNNMTCSNALDTMKISGYVPFVHSFPDDIPSNDVQCYIPNGKIGPKINDDSHSLSKKFTVDTDVDPGYVFSTDVNAICQTGQKSPSNVKDIEVAGEGENHASQTDKRNPHDQTPIGSLNEGHRNTKPLVTGTTETDKANVLNYADNNLDLENKSEREIESRCKPMYKDYKDGYITHLAV